MLGTRSLWPSKPGKSSGMPAQGKGKYLPSLVGIYNKTSNVGVFVLQ